MSNVNNDFFWGNFTPGVETHPRESASRAGNDLDKDAFLRLLITQMQYQDPLDPVSDKEFVAQLAQFTALEQMQNLNRSMLYQQAFSMVGKLVIGSTFDESQGRYMDVAGRVDSVVIDPFSKDAFLIVAGNRVKLDRVTDITDDPTQMNLWQNINNNIFTHQNLALIGQNVQALTRNERGEVTGYVEGKVEYLRFGGSAPMLVIGDREVFPQEVISVSSSPLLLGRQITVEVAGESFTGPILGISIVNDKAFVRVGENQAEIGAIDTFTEAVQSVGRTVTGTIITGEGVTAQARTVTGPIQRVIVGGGGNVFVEIQTVDDDDEIVMERVLFSNVQRER